MQPNYVLILSKTQLRIWLCYARVDNPSENCGPNWRSDYEFSYPKASYSTISNKFKAQPL